ncbi:MAG TPA: hypothetical protein VKS22_07175 [Candidatus Binataceae bacterium]|nr:hypothetical protein [Candidatus Binataceae bacterium]
MSTGRAARERQVRHPRISAGSGARIGTAIGLLLLAATGAMAAPTSGGGSGSGGGGGAGITVGSIAVPSGGTLAAPIGRAGSGLNLESATIRGDANYTILATDRMITTNAAFTAPRTFTLPAVSAINPAQELIIADAAGGISSTNTLTIVAAGSDTISGGASVTLSTAFSLAMLRPDGNGHWVWSGSLPFQCAGDVNGACSTIVGIDGIPITGSPAGTKVLALNSGGTAWVFTSYCPDPQGGVGAVLVDQASGCLTSVTNGTNGQVFLAHSGAQPTWGALPFANLAGSIAVGQGAMIPYATINGAPAQTITNSATATAIYGPTAIPANTLTAGGCFVIQIAGIETYDNSTSDTLALLVKLGGTTIVSGNTPNPGTISATGRVWLPEVWICNANSNNKGQIEWMTGKEQGNSSIGVNGGTSAVDMTTSENLELDVQWSAASANDSIAIDLVKIFQTI